MVVLWVPLCEAVGAVMPPKRALVCLLCQCGWCGTLVVLQESSVWVWGPRLGPPATRCVRQGGGGGVRGAGV